MEKISAKVNSVVNWIFEKGISESESVWRLSDAIIRRPDKFFFIAPESEDVSQFVFSSKKALQRLIRGFDASRGDGAKFLRVTVQRSFSSWKHRSMRRKFRESCAAEYLYKTMDVYDGALFVSAADSESDEVDFGRVESAKSRIGGEHADEALLCLALRCAFELDDAYIKKIADMCGIAVSKMFALVQSVKQRCERKFEIARHKIDAVNAAYIMGCASASAAEWLSDESAEHERQMTFSECQLRRFKELRARCRQITPSCKVISEAMGIPRRRVEFLLKKSLNSLKDFC